MNQAAPAPARDLPQRLIERIRADGPLSTAEYMAAALYDPRAGYYATKNPIGAGGDFVTAPEISQTFGELVGLWCVQAWLDMGAPAGVRLVELGPGRGTMMADMLRAMRVRPEFLQAVDVWLVDVSPALENAAGARLASAPVTLRQARRLEDVSPGPAIIVANEFLDCLPVRQFVKADGRWRERLVGLDPAGPDRLAFHLAPAPISERNAALIPAPLRAAPEGALVEARPAVDHVTGEIAQRFQAYPGRALFIDYGPAASEPGDTLQAVHAHQKVDPLERAGQADLTARVDFAALKASGDAAGLDVAGPISQGAFLMTLGIEHRAAALMQANPKMKATLARQIHRLTDDAEMGTLFQALCLSSPGLPAPAGFAP